MKLSEFLVLHPDLDIDISAKDEDFYLDGVYLFRFLAEHDQPGDTTFKMYSSKHTDIIVKTGLLQTALSIDAFGWNQQGD